MVFLFRKANVAITFGFTSFVFLTNKHRCSSSLVDGNLLGSSSLCHVYSCVRQFLFKKHVLVTASMEGHNTVQRSNTVLSLKNIGFMRLRLRLNEHNQCLSSINVIQHATASFTLEKHLQKGCTHSTMAERCAGTTKDSALGKSS